MAFRIFLLPEDLEKTPKILPAHVLPKEAWAKLSPKQWENLISS